MTTECDGRLLGRSAHVGWISNDSFQCFESASLLDCITAECVLCQN